MSLKPDNAALKPTSTSPWPPMMLTLTLLIGRFSEAEIILVELSFNE